MLELLLGLVLVAVILGAGLYVHSRLGAPDASSRDTRASRSTPPRNHGGNEVLVALSDDDDGAAYIVQRGSAAPESATAIPPSVASRIHEELLQLAPTAKILNDVRGEVFLRLVKAPPGGLSKVAGNPSLYRGVGHTGRGISGDVELARVRPSGVVAPTLILAVASAAVGAYWQQQMHEALQGIRASVGAIQMRLDTGLQAKLDLAEETLTEHEADPPSGRYEPPGAITDGMHAFRIDRRELAQRLEQLRDLGDHDLSHEKYRFSALGHDGGTPLIEQAFRALRGLAIDLRVNRLKRVAGLGLSDEYHEYLDAQSRRHEKDLELIRSVLSSAQELESSNKHAGMKFELPYRRKRRLRTAKQRAEQDRDQLAQLLELTNCVRELVPQPLPEDFAVDIYLRVDEDGVAEAEALPLNDKH